MCIRDSANVAATAAAVALSYLLGRDLSRGDRTVGVTTAAPVSYTHLRAHETVLDLVCRLLLEKKNPPRHKYLAQYTSRNIRTTA